MNYAVIWKRFIFNEDLGTDEFHTTTEYFKEMNKATSKFEEMKNSDEAMEVQLVAVIDEYVFV